QITSSSPFFPTSTLNNGSAPSAGNVQNALRSTPLFSGNEVQKLTLNSPGPVRLSFLGSGNAAYAQATQDLNVVTSGVNATQAADVQAHLQTIPGLSGSTV